MIICPTCNNKIENPIKGQIYCNKICYYKSSKLKEQAKNSKLISLNNLPYEEKFGKEKSERIKKEHSIFMKNNPNSGQFKNGEHNINEWKNEHVPWNKGIEMTNEFKNKLSLIKKGKYKGEESSRWKGDEVGYGALHQWLDNNFKKNNKCEICSASENIDWANISNKYKRDRNDFICLCHKCHMHFDSIKRKKLYEVMAVECKSNGQLSKEEKEKCEWLILNNIFPRILIAYKSKEGRKIIVNYKEFFI